MEEIILWKFTTQISGLKKSVISFQPGYYGKVQDVIDDTLLKAGLADTTDVVVSYDDTSKKVTVRCVKGTVLELRGDIARMFGYLNNMAIRASDKIGFTLALPETGNQYFYVYTDIIKSHGDVVVPVIHTVTVKGEHGSYVSKNFKRSHYVSLNKKIVSIARCGKGREYQNSSKETPKRKQSSIPRRYCF